MTESRLAPWLSASRWPTAPIRLVARLGSGHTPSRSRSEYWENCTVPWITLADVWQLRDGRTTVISETKEMVSPLGLANSAAVKHPAGTVILSRTASVGFSAIMGRNMATSQDFATWTCGPNLEPRYLLHALRGMAPDLKRVATGSTHKTIYMPDIEQLRVPLPPLEHQRCIADFLDAETARIDHLIYKFDRQRTLIREREKAALPLAVGGALLGDGQIETDIPWFAKAHPDSALVPLIRVLQLQRGVDLSESQRRPGNVPVFTTAGAAGWHDTAIADGPGVVIGRYGSVGNVHWTDQPYWPHNTTLYVKNFAGNDRRYCYHLLRAIPYDMEQARAAVPGVNRNDLHKQLVPLVPRRLQERASRQADELATWRHATRSRIERAQVLLKERRQALITAAVTGQFDVSTASGRNVIEGVSV
ncbi:restriction endonuclease subunit S [Streptomyces tendae]